MSLETVAEEIINGAKQEAEKMKEEARREAGKIILSAKENIEEKRRAAEPETQGIIEAMAKKELASVRLDEKRLILDAKKGALDKVYAGISENVLGLNSKAKEKIYAKFAQNAQREIELAYVYAADEDLAIARSLLPNARTGLAKISGGLIFENEGRTVRIDMSFDNVLSQVKSEQMGAVSKILFGEGA